MLRAILHAALVGFSFLLHSEVAAGQAATFYIPGQPADSALTAFAEQANISVLFPYDEVREVTTNTLIGEYTVEDGLRELLEGTPLRGTVSRRGSSVDVVVSLDRMFLAPLLPGVMPPVEEITVTGRRREEHIQDVAMSIEAFSKDDLEMKGVNSGRDLNTIAPNFQFGRGSASAEATDLVIRGIPSVGVYLDGVWQGSRGFLEGPVLGLERIEILRGPQGTLFGRNTNGGAVQYITRPPGETFEGEVKIALGEYQRRDLEIDLNAPLSQQLATRLTAASRRRSGFLTNSSTNRTFGNMNSRLLRGDILWRPTLDTAARFSVILDSTESTFERQIRFVDPDNYITTAYNVVALNPEYGSYDFTVRPPEFGLPIRAFTPRSHEAGYPNGEVGDWETKSDQPKNAHSMLVQQYALTLTWDLAANMSLQSLSAYREQLTNNVADLDASEITIQTDYRIYRDLWRQQEFHLRGAFLRDRLNFLIGGFWGQSDTYERLYRWGTWEFFLESADGNPVINTDMLSFVREWGVANGQPQFAEFNLRNAFRDDLEQIEVTDRAIFGEIEYVPSYRWRLTGGMRWSWNDTSVHTYQPTEARRTWLPPTRGGPGRESGDPFAGVLIVDAENDSPDGIFTPKLSAAYNFREEVMAYLSYSEGYTSGERIYVPEVDKEIELAPEVVSTYEFGLRSDWLRRRLRFNATYFSSEWEGIRVPVLPPDPQRPGGFLPLPYITSSGEARVRGFEADVVFVPSDKWRVDLAMGFLDTEYREIGDPAETSLRYGALFQFAPKITSALRAQYRRPVPSGGSIVLRADYGYVSEYQRSAAIQRQSERPEPAYGLLNGRIQYTAPAGRWSVAAFGSNLTNTRYVDSGIVSPPFGLDFIQIGPPRQLGLALSYVFQ